MAFKVKTKREKVGNLDLTKAQRKRVFYLPIENAIYVPSTYGEKEQKEISDKEMAKRVAEVRRFLSKNYGGYTSVKAVGGYVLKDGKLVKENVVKVTSFSTKEDFEKNEDKTFEQVGKWGKKWKQESVGYENEGDLFYVSPRPYKKK